MAQQAKARGELAMAFSEPPLGHLQAVIISKFEKLGRDAYGYKLLEEVSRESGSWSNPTQIYTAIRNLANKTPTPYLEHSETRDSKDGGPPFKVYKVTPAGRAALKETIAHYRAILAVIAAG